jgi:hypothetical protein
MFSRVENWVPLEKLVTDRFDNAIKALIDG